MESVCASRHPGFESLPLRQFFEGGFEASECRAHSEEKAVSHRPAVSERGEVTQGAPATVGTKSRHPPQILILGLRADLEWLATPLEGIIGL